MINLRKTAFTLAEVLITLAIIGVVASMTIPSLMQSTQDQELKAAWKKEFSVLSNATEQLAQDNGGSIAGLCNDNDCLRDLYKPYLKNQKLCDSGQAEGNCWPASGKFYFLDGKVVPSNTIDPYQLSGLVLNDGTFVLFTLESESCTSTNWNILRCGWISVDVNGFKGPNKFGKDMFMLHLFKNQIKPYGTQEDNVGNKCEGSTGTWSGWSCGAEYLYH